MIIKPIRDKKTKEQLTNVETCKRVYHDLKVLKSREGDKAQQDYYNLFGGSQSEKEVMDFLAYVCDDNITYQEAQRRLTTGLIYPSYLK